MTEHSMDLSDLLKDENAVSPVIGVILMVAITVILAAVIGTFVLGLGEQVSDTSPQVTFTFDFDKKSGLGSQLAGQAGGGATTGELTLTHDGGDQIQASQVTIKDDDGNSVDGTTVFGTEITAGSMATVNVDSDDTVRIVWEASGGGSTSTLGKWTGPDE